MGTINTLTGIASDATNDLVAVNWAADVDMTTQPGWDGITIGGSPSRVTGLDLSGKGLGGTIPPALKGLVGLESLDLSGNQLTGSIPAELGNFPNLTTLNLTGNQFTGCVPREVWDIQNTDARTLGLSVCGPVTPSRVLTPTVTAGNASLSVNWTAPFSQGSSILTHYRIQHKQAAHSSWLTASSTTGTSKTISGLTNGTSYEVRVQACSSEGCGDWSFSENGTPAANPGALPPTPTGLGANGHIVNGQVSLWWQASTGSTDYNLRYAVETCTDTPQKTASVCSPGEWNEVNRITTTSSTLSAGTGNNDQLTSKTEYRLQVRGTNANGQSGWSDVAFVYPTFSAPRAGGLLPPSDPPLIATFPLYGHQPENDSGDHEFRYIICDGTIPTGVSINAAQIAAAVEKWEEAVKKDSSGNSMVKTTRDYYPTPAPEGACTPSDGWWITGVFPSGGNEVMFVNDDAIGRTRCGTAHGCWRSHTWDSLYVSSIFGRVTDLPSIAKGTLLLRETKSVGGNASDWNALAYSNAPCKFVEHAIVHEVGHALGIGWPLNDHPRNSTLSVMSSGVYGGDKNYCEPQAYDVVALMANYQSR